MGGPVDFLSEEYKDLVRTATELFESDSDTISFRNQNFQRFNSRLEVLLDEFPVDPRDLLMSQGYLTGAMRQFLFDLRDEGDPGNAFEANYENLIEELSSRPIEDFRIGMPWSLRFRRGDGPDQLEILGETFQRLPRQRWMSQFISVARGSEDFESVIDASVNDPTESRTYTFWEHTIEARDPQYAIDRVEELIEVLFGKLLYMSQFQQSYPMRIGQDDIWPRGWANLKNPFIYIVLRNGSYFRTYFDEDVSKRRPERIDAQELEEFIKAFPRLGEGSPILSEITGALRSLQSALITPDNKKAFLDLWRTLDICTLANRRLGIEKILRRGAATIQFNLPKPVLEHRLQKMEAKRNSLVHQDIGTEIEKRDIEFMHALVEGSLWFLWAHLRDYSRQDIIYFLKEAQKSEQELKARYNGVKREMELLKDLLEEE